MSKYRKKPIIVEAWQFFYSGPTVPGVFYPAKSEDGRTYIGDAFVVTIHDQRAYLANGDWVIAEPDGEHHYPCKPDIFEATYEDVQARIAELEMPSEVRSAIEAALRVIRNSLDEPSEVFSEWAQAKAKAEIEAAFVWLDSVADEARP